jgi:GTP-binding protein HflX
MSVDERELQEHRLREEGKEIKNALVVGVHLQNVDRKVCEEHLDELELLAQTCGFDVVGKVPITLRKYDTATHLTKGKLEELVEIANECNPDIIIFDDEIFPSQQRNLEKIFGHTVMDRTELIIEVFGQRAQTKEAQLQVELARTKYQLPRLKRMWTHLERQSGGGSGGVFVKGMGEKQIEIDKRLLHKKLTKIERELKEVQVHRKTQREARIRQGIPTLAIIGYTNAGKSTLLNALTDAGILAEDKLFATLDTTTRKFTLPNNQDVLLVDTVGFIRKLPHTLIAAFKGTLEEAVNTDILIHLIDISNPMAEEQTEACFEVLKELKASDKAMITVLNKVDACENLSIVDRLRIKFPKPVMISATEQTGFDDLLSAMEEELSKRRKKVKLRIPQSDYEVVSALQRDAHIIETDYEGNDVIIVAEIAHEMAARLEKYEETAPAS